MLTIHESNLQDVGNKFTPWPGFFFRIRKEGKGRQKSYKSYMNKQVVTVLEPL